MLYCERRDAGEVADRLAYPISLSEALVTRRGLALRGDGPPLWREGRTNRPAQTAAEARGARRNLIKLLRRSRDDIGELHDLARRLRACSPTDPCCSGACPVCWRALRRLLVHVSQPLFGVSGRYAFVTCVCDEDCVRQGKPLNVEAITAAERRLMDAVVRARMRIFGAIDISANEHEHNRFHSHYQAHAHFLPLQVAFDHKRSEIDRCYASALVDTPVLAKPFDGNMRGVAYVFDTPTLKRTSLDARKRPDGRARANTRHKPLVSQQRVAMARLLDRAGIEARVLLYGYELHTDRKNVWMVTVDGQRANELLAKRRQRIFQRQAELANRDRQRTRERLKLERSCSRTLWQDPTLSWESWTL